LGLENVLRADHASFAGFESNNPAIPYMRHVTTDAVIRLATTTALQNGLNDKQDKDATLTTLSGKDANGILQYLGYESGSGWVKLPGGLIIQRGRVGHPVGVTAVLVTLPRAFTSLEYSVAQSWSDIQNIATGDVQNPASNGTQFSSRTLTTFQSWQAGPGGFNTDYIAMGY
ncbi:gp53-like domain-containing protein, partial [Citrobacter portucalensis]